jgi:DNA-binding GntR family transcriptional regulator
LCRCLAETSAASLADYRRLDSRLHLAIAEVTGSPSLTSATADVRMRLNELLDAIPLLERNIQHSNDQHQAIVDAILADDPEVARRAMQEHLSGTAALLRAFLA